MNPVHSQWAAAIIFGIATVHRFPTRHFDKLVHERLAHAGKRHWLIDATISRFAPRPEPLITEPEAAD